MEVHKEQHHSDPKPIVSQASPFTKLECQKSFQALSKNQKLYAYYLTRAAWVGSTICYFQRSYESPILLHLLLQAFKSEPPKQLTERLVHSSLLDKQTTEELLFYFCGFLNNCGNYKSFGDSKFIPDTDLQSLKTYLSESKYWSQHKQLFNQLFSSISTQLQKYDGNYGLLAFSDQGGTSGYYSQNVTQGDAEKVKNVLAGEKILSENNRLVKVKEGEFVVRVASVEKQGVQRVIEKEGVKVRLQYGDFSEALALVNRNLGKAMEYAANDTQKKMLQAYIEHFRTGDMQKFKESQVLWVEDKGPAIETNIGFIESYLDPLRVRAEYEGFVAVVNKVESAILLDLVNHAEKIIQYLPWGKDFELDKFNKPDFTSLDVLSFASSGIPVGINIPNFDDIRKEHGFKNVNLGNAYGSPNKQTVQFIPESLIDLYIKQSNTALFVTVALHQLLGHGTGKLFHQPPPPTINNPLGYQPTSYYIQGETWHSVFGQLASGYQQCRADSVALYLSTYPDVLDILLPNLTAEQKDQVLYITWYDNVLGALRGLEYYDVPTKKWTQAHIAASFAIFSVIREAGGILEIKEVEKQGKKNLEMRLDKTLIRTKGKEAIGRFLQALQVYKATADLERGTKFFKRYLQVDEELIKFRKIVVANKRPRRIQIQPEVFLKNGEVEYKDYEASLYGCIESNVDHLREVEGLLEMIKRNKQFNNLL